MIMPTRRQCANAIRALATRSRLASAHTHTPQKASPRLWPRSVRESRVITPCQLSEAWLGASFIFGWSALMNCA